MPLELKDINEYLGIDANEIDSIDKFKEKFDIRPRSEGLFSTFDMYEAERYGRPFLVFPVGNYASVFRRIRYDHRQFTGHGLQHLFHVSVGCRICKRDTCI